MTQQAAYEIPIFNLGVLEANSNLTSEVSNQFMGVDVIAASGTGVVGPAAIAAPVSSGAAIIGILQNNPQIAEAAVVMCVGVSKALAGGSIAIGAILTCNANGQFVTAASGNYGHAKALQAASAANQIISVLLRDFGKQ